MWNAAAWDIFRIVHQHGRFGIPLSDLVDILVSSSSEKNTNNSNTERDETQLLRWPQSVLPFYGACGRNNNNNNNDSDRGRAQSRYESQLQERIHQHSRSLGFSLKNEEGSQNALRLIIKECLSSSSQQRRKPWIQAVLLRKDSSVHSARQTAIKTFENAIFASAAVSSSSKEDSTIATNTTTGDDHNDENDSKNLDRRRKREENENENSNENNDTAATAALTTTIKDQMAALRKYFLGSDPFTTNNNNKNNKQHQRKDDDFIFIENPEDNKQFEEILLRQTTAASAKLTDRESENNNNNNHNEYELILCSTTALQQTLFPSLPLAQDGFDLVVAAGRFGISQLALGRIISSNSAYRCFETWKLHGVIVARALLTLIEEQNGKLRDLSSRRIFLKEYDPLLLAEPASSSSSRFSALNSRFVDVLNFTAAQLFQRDQLPFLAPTILLRTLMMAFRVEHGRSLSMMWCFETLFSSSLQGIWSLGLFMEACREIGVRPILVVNNNNNNNGTVTSKRMIARSGCSLKNVQLDPPTSSSAVVNNTHHHHTTTTLMNTTAGNNNTTTQQQYVKDYDYDDDEDDDDQTENNNKPRLSSSSPAPDSRDRSMMMSNNTNNNSLSMMMSNNNNNSKSSHPHHHSELHDKKNVRLFGQYGSGFTVLNAPLALNPDRAVEETLVNDYLDRKPNANFGVSPSGCFAALQNEFGEHILDQTRQFWNAKKKAENNKNSHLQTVKVPSGRSFINVWISSDNNNNNQKGATDSSADHRLTLTLSQVAESIQRIVFDDENSDGFCTINELRNHDTRTISRFVKAMDDAKPGSVFHSSQLPFKKASSLTGKNATTVFYDTSRFSSDQEAISAAHKRSNEKQKESKKQSQTSMMSSMRSVKRMQDDSDDDDDDDGNNKTSLLSAARTTTMFKSNFKQAISGSLFAQNRISAEFALRLSRNWNQELAEDPIKWAFIDWLTPTLLALWNITLDDLIDESTSINNISKSRNTSSSSSSSPPPHSQTTIRKYNLLDILRRLPLSVACTLGAAGADDAQQQISGDDYESTLENLRPSLRQHFFKDQTARNNLTRSFARALHNLSTLGFVTVTNDHNNNNINKNNTSSGKNKKKDDDKDEDENDDDDDDDDYDNNKQHSAVEMTYQSVSFSMNTEVQFQEKLFFDESKFQAGGSSHVSTLSNINKNSNNNKNSQNEQKTRTIGNFTLPPSTQHDSSQQHYLKTTLKNDFFLQILEMCQELYETLCSVRHNAVVNKMLTALRVARASSTMLTASKGFGSGSNIGTSVISNTHLGALQRTLDSLLFDVFKGHQLLPESVILEAAKEFSKLPGVVTLRDERKTQNHEPKPTPEISLMHILEYISCVIPLRRHAQKFGNSKDYAFLKSGKASEYEEDDSDDNENEDEEEEEEEEESETSSSNESSNDNQDDVPPKIIASSNSRGKKKAPAPKGKNVRFNNRNNNNSAKNKTSTRFLDDNYDDGGETTSSEEFGASTTSDDDDDNEETVKTKITAKKRPAPKRKAAVRRNSSSKTKAETSSSDDDDADATTSSAQDESDDSDESDNKKSKQAAKKTTTAGFGKYAQDGTSLMSLRGKRVREQNFSTDSLVHDWREVQFYRPPSKELKSTVLLNNATAHFYSTLCRILRLERKSELLRKPSRDDETSDENDTASTMMMMMTTNSNNNNKKRTENNNNNKQQKKIVEKSELITIWKEDENREKGNKANNNDDSDDDENHQHRRTLKQRQILLDRIMNLYVQFKHLGNLKDGENDDDENTEDSQTNTSSVSFSASFSAWLPDDSFAHNNDNKNKRKNKKSSDDDDDDDGSDENDDDELEINKWSSTPQERQKFIQCKKYLVSVFYANNQDYDKNLDAIVQQKSSSLFSQRMLKSALKSLVYEDEVANSHASSANSRFMCATPNWITDRNWFPEFRGADFGIRVDRSRNKLNDIFFGDVVENSNSNNNNQRQRNQHLRREILEHPSTSIVFAESAFQNIMNMVNSSSSTRNSNNGNAAVSSSSSSSSSLLVPTPTVNLELLTSDRISLDFLRQSAHKKNAHSINVEQNMIQTIDALENKVQLHVSSKKNNNSKHNKDIDEETQRHHHDDHVVDENRKNSELVKMLHKFRLETASSSIVENTNTQTKLPNSSGAQSQRRTTLLRNTVVVSLLRNTAMSRESNSLLSRWVLAFSEEWKKQTTGGEGTQQVHRHRRAPRRRARQSSSSSDDSSEDDDKKESNDDDDKSMKKGAGIVGGNALWNPDDSVNFTNILFVVLHLYDIIFDFPGMTERMLAQSVRVPELVSKNEFQMLLDMLVDAKMINRRSYQSDDEANHRSVNFEQTVNKRSFVRNDSEKHPFDDAAPDWVVQDREKLSFEEETHHHKFRKFFYRPENSVQDASKLMNGF